MKVQREAIPPFRLSSLTCKELYDIVSTKPTGKERKQLREIRKWFGNHKFKLALLEMCDDLKATYFKAYIKTASHLAKIPVIELRIGKGPPKRIKMPPWSKSLKKLAEHHGVTIHRWGRGAFILKKP